mmetsp:Transcript_68032/g.199103  ORF Transcript_68032/g.199103 Transcript_68032/m.199103 type:complete len:221 (-) Transcript_68032:139-801(-)
MAPAQRRPLLGLAAAALALLTALRAASQAFASAAPGPAPLRPGSEGLRGASRVATRVSLTSVEEEATETKVETKKTKKKQKPVSKIIGLSEEELAARKAKALDIWESMKVDIAEELERYQTFRPDKFEKFMRSDSRGMALFELYEPGTPEYAEFFEETMGPYIFELAQVKLKEGLGQVAGVILVVGTICAILAVFGTDIIQTLTAPFTGFAEQFVEMYGF